VYVLCKGKIVIRGFVVILLALFSALNFESSLFAQNEDAVARPNQTSTGSQTVRSTVAGKRRSRQRRRATKRKKCMPQSPSESTKSNEPQPPTMDTPPLILDPTDREPGPPKEIIPKHIDPADMPAIKKPPKKKTKPQ